MVVTCVGKAGSEIWVVQVCPDFDCPLIEKKKKNQNQGNIALLAWITSKKM